MFLELTILLVGIVIGLVAGRAIWEPIDFDEEFKI